MNKRIEAEAEKYSQDGLITSTHARMGYIAGATSEYNRAAPLVEALEKIKNDPYPKSVFIPFTDGEWLALKIWLNNQGIAIDRLSAEYGRIIRKQDQQIATEVLNNYKNKEA